MGFEFDEETMRCLGHSLEILEAEKNHMKNINGSEFLLNLRILRIANNSIENLESIDKQLYCMGNLRSLDLKGNPVSKMNKFRDQIIMITNENFGKYKKEKKCFDFLQLEELDDKNILPKEREFIMKFYNIQK